MLIASTLQRLDDGVDYLFKRNTYELFEAVTTDIRKKIGYVVPFPILNSSPGPLLNLK